MGKSSYLLTITVLKKIREIIKFVAIQRNVSNLLPISKMRGLFFLFSLKKKKKVKWNCEILVYYWFQLDRSLLEGFIHLHVCKYIFLAVFLRLETFISVYSSMTKVVPQDTNAHYSSKKVHCFLKKSTGQSNNFEKYQTWLNQVPSPLELMRSYYTTIRLSL